MSDPLFTIQIKKSSKLGSESHTRGFHESPFSRKQTRAKLHEAVDQFCDMMRVLPKTEEGIAQHPVGDRGSLVRE
jgi:hypothetical protein